MDLFFNPQEPHLPFPITDSIDYSWRWDKRLQAFFITLANGQLIFAESFFNEKISQRCVEYFQEHECLGGSDTGLPYLNMTELERIDFTHIKWQQDHIQMYGKRIPLPRLTSWYGDSGKRYSYSGISLHPRPWNKGLRYIKDTIEQATGFSFNSVLLNWYRSGDDHMSWHADDEPELGRNPVIASVNFGETRDFVLRRMDDPTQKITIPLRHGSLLVMAGELQHYWQHSVPKRKKVQGSRFNLTFRTII